MVINMQNDPKVIVALDYNDVNKAKEFVQRVDPTICNLKVGKELFTLCGPSFVEYLVNKDFRVFLDLKFHDIPNTVASAVKVAANMGVWLVDMHLLGGRKMLEKAVEAIDNLAYKPKLIGVSVLTSMADEDLKEVGIANNTFDEVALLAKLAYECKLSGMVSSALEAENIKAITDKNFITVTPGIRPENYQKDDQTRILTPQQAVKRGCDYLVIGRPITGSNNPYETLSLINEQIKEC